MDKVRRHPWEVADAARPSQKPPQWTNPEDIHSKVADRRTVILRWFPRDVPAALCVFPALPVEPVEVGHVTPSSLLLAPSQQHSLTESTLRDQMNVCGFHLKRLFLEPWTKWFDLLKTSRLSFTQHSAWVTVVLHNANSFYNPSFFILTAATVRSPQPLVLHGDLWPLTSGCKQVEAGEVTGEWGAFALIGGLKKQNPTALGVGGGISGQQEIRIEFKLFSCQFELILLFNS